MKYDFISAHRTLLRVHFLGFYAWLNEPLRQRAQKDVRQSALVRQASWTKNVRIYSYRKLADDLRDLGETTSKNRAARLASGAGIMARVGRFGCKPAVVAENRREQQFQISWPGNAEATDIA